MTKARPRNPAAASKELSSLASTFVLIRIMKHAADAPLDTARLRERLNANGRPLAPVSLNRILVRLRRHGWLNTKDSFHSLTPAGRKALKLATSGLKTLAGFTSRSAGFPACRIAGFLTCDRSNRNAGLMYTRCITTLMRPWATLFVGRKI